MMIRKIAFSTAMIWACAMVNAQPVAIAKDSQVVKEGDSDATQARQLLDKLKNLRGQAQGAAEKSDASEVSPAEQDGAGRGVEPSPHRPKLDLLGPTTQGGSDEVKGELSGEPNQNIQQGTSQDSQTVKVPADSNTADVAEVDKKHSDERAEPLPKSQEKVTYSSGSRHHGESSEEVGHGRNDVIPEISAEVLREGVPRPINRTATKSKGFELNESSALVMEPGVNQLVPVAIDQINRIVTPFDMATVKMSKLNGPPVDITSQGRVVYVTLTQDTPLSLFIYEKGDDSLALSLTLIPQRIPARELTLALPATMPVNTRNNNPVAERFERSQPYINTVRTVFRHVALGEVPPGYALSNVKPDVQVPICRAPGLAFDFSHGQIMVGHSFDVFVGVVKNAGATPVEVMEQGCGNWNVAAVAAWPDNVLDPGKSSEVYLMTKKAEQQTRAAKRPSLIEGD